jgi:hypothetical protein
MNTNEKLLKLCDFLDSLKDEQFDFSSWTSARDEHDCGTVCCAAGWIPAAFPEEYAAQWRKEWPESNSITFAPCIAMAFLGLSKVHFERLFLSFWFNDELLDAPPKWQVVARIRDWVWQNS